MISHRDVLKQKLEVQLNQTHCTTGIEDLIINSKDYKLESTYLLQDLVRD